MALITGIGVTFVQSLFDGTIKELVFEIRDKEGVTEQDAKDIVHNMLVDVLINSAASFLLVKAKIPTKTAQYLGLTTSSPKKKALSAAATAATAKLAKDGGKAAATSVIPKILKIAAIPGTLIWLVNAIANIVEPGIYKPSQTNAVYKKLGIPFQYPETESQLQPGPFDGAAFRDYAKAVETAGVKGIENPIALQSQIYSRQALADVVNYVYGQEVVKGNAPSAKQLIPMLAKYLVGGTTVKTTTTTISSPTSQATTTPTVKVFTGVVSQGVVGAGLTFQPRIDDLIEDVNELRSAAANNLAPFLAALPAKVTYEIKVVSSIVTANGFRQTGTTQKVQTGTNKDGTPKYKTVTNKFATLILYILTDRGTRTKLSTVVLGPVDSARFTVTSNDLITLAQDLPKIVTTSNTDDIDKVISNTPTETVMPAQGSLGAKMKELGILFIKGNAANPYTYLYLPAHQVGSASYPRFVHSITNPENLSLYGITSEMLTPLDALPTIKDGNTTQDYLYGANFGRNIKAEEVLSVLPGAGFVLGTVPVVASGESQNNKLGADAKTLSEWYQAQGKTLPSVQERSVIYQELGLGQASYYTGTAEQNTKLLSALKAQ